MPCAGLYRYILMYSTGPCIQVTQFCWCNQLQNDIHATPGGQNVWIMYVCLVPSGSYRVCALIYAQLPPPIFPLPFALTFPFLRRFPPAGLLVEKNFWLSSQRWWVHVLVFGSPPCSFGLENAWYWGKPCNVTCTLVFFINEVIYIFCYVTSYFILTYVGSPCVLLVPQPSLYPPRFPIRLVYLTYSVFIRWSG
jgi:hypothetical protein